MTETITVTAIRERIADSAKEIVDEAATEDEAMDAIHETVDSMDWVLYYSKAHRVCMTLDANSFHFNDVLSEAFDEMRDCDGLTGVETLDQLYAKLAFFALSRLLTEAVETAWKTRQEAA